MCAVGVNSKLDEGLCGVMKTKREQHPKEGIYVRCTRSQDNWELILKGLCPYASREDQFNWYVIKVTHIHRLRLLLLEELEDLSGEECTATSIFHSIIGSL